MAAFLNVEILKREFNLMIKDLAETNEPDNRVTILGAYYTDGDTEVTESTTITVQFQDGDEIKTCTLPLFSKEMRNFHLPPNMRKGHAVARGHGNYFFDSFRMGLERLGRSDSVRRMRAVCKAFAGANPPEWFVAAISCNHDSVREYIANIEQIESWADADVEGRILCAHYDLSLYVIERQTANGEPLYIYQVVSGSGCRYVTEVSFEEENAIYIINEGGGHFEPIIDGRADISQGREDVLSVNLDTMDITQNREKTAVAEKLAIDAFNKFENAIKIGDLKHLRKLIKFLFRTVDRMELARLYRDPRNSIRLTHPVTLACEYGQHDVLSFLLHKTNVLHYLGVEGRQKERARVRALVAAMLAEDTRLLEALYEHWAGAAHWLAVGAATGPVLHELTWLRVLLLKARDRCFPLLRKDEQLLINVHCVITFNEFQIELYTKLGQVKARHDVQGLEGDRKREVDAMRDALLTAFEIYDHNSNKNIRLSKDLAQDKEILEPLLLQKDSIYMKCITYMMYELYYRKLDHNIALLIINNLYALKLRLQMPVAVYQDIEAVLYYFLYRVRDDWSLYLPKNRPVGKKLILGSDEFGNLGIYKVPYDPHRDANGIVLYLERSAYKKHLHEFKAALEHVSHNKLREEGSKLSDEEVNSLSVLPYMRDDYSLKKMLEYMDHLSFVDMTRDKTGSLLIIERVIQMTGEFLKSSKESRHLSPITTALLKCKIPNDVYKNLCNLRDYLCHSREGKLIRRIDLEETASELFSNVVADLNKIKKSLEEVVRVYKYLLDQFLLSSGWHLLWKRRGEWPKEATLHTQKESMQQMYLARNISVKHYVELENKFLDEHWKELGLSRQLIREVIDVVNKMSILLDKKYECHCESYTVTLDKLPSYTKHMKAILDVMTPNNVLWSSVRHELWIMFSNNLNFTRSIKDHPNKECIKIIRRELTNVNKSAKHNLLQKLQNVKDYSAEWNQIRDLLKYLITEVGIFFKHSLEMKNNYFTKLLGKIYTSYPNKKAIRCARRMIKCLNDIAPTRTQHVLNNQDYSALSALEKALRQNHFITKDELEYFRANTDGSCLCDANQRCIHAALYAKLYDGAPIHERDYENAKTLVMNSKCRKIITNLTNGKKRNNSRVECLLRRSEQLARAVGATRSPEVLAVRYRHDGKFRCVAEMLTSDILNIYGESALGPLFNERRTRLLAESPLRNVLEHGSPLLEVGGAVFDDEDYPHALMALALAALEDLPAVRLLAALLDQGVLLDSPALQPAQRDLVARFEACPNWQAYAKLAKVLDKNTTNQPSDATDA